jgi:hypothetical protein
VNTRGITGTGCGYGAVSKSGTRTRTRDTRFGNTAGLPAPAANPSLKQTISRWARTSRYVASYKFDKDRLFFSSRGGLFEPEKAGPGHIFVDLSVV